MAKRNEEVFEAVKKLVKRKPDAKVDDALKEAQKIDSGIDPDDKRSFNARYLLPAKRTLGTAGKKKAGKKKTRKKKTRKSTRKKTSRRKKAAAVSDKARELILARDQKILELAKGEVEPRDAYNLAADVDDFLKKLRKSL